MATFPLKILTPDGVAYDGPAVSVSCRTINGQVQLLAKHIDFCTALGMGEAHIKLEDGTTRRAACMGGMLSMLKGECRLLATTFEWADAIDAERQSGGILSFTAVGGVFETPRQHLPFAPTHSIIDA